MANKKPRTRITRVDAEAKMKKVADWRASTPQSGSSTEAWRNWGKANPNRVSNAARVLREPKGSRTESPDETTEEWQARMPKGGGRGVAAPHPEWVAWGKSKPGRASRAAKTVRGQGKQKTQTTKVAKKASAPKKGKKNG